MVSQLWRGPQSIRSMRIYISSTASSRESWEKGATGVHKQEAADIGSSSLWDEVFHTDMALTAEGSLWCNIHRRIYTLTHIHTHTHKDKRNELARETGQPWHVFCIEKETTFLVLEENEKRKVPTLPRYDR